MVFAARDLEHHIAGVADLGCHQRRYRVTYKRVRAALNDVADAVDKSLATEQTSR
jgi:hypothetical protein